jgi:FkbM family methyltransferase
LALRRDDRKRTREYARRKPPGVVQRTVNGSRMILSMDDCGIHRDLYLDGVREPGSTRFFASCLSKEDTVLDIGANIGYYALLEAPRVRRVFAAEPCPDNVERLRENIRINSCDNVVVVPKAFGGTVGTGRLNISSRSNWHSLLPARETTAGVPVEVTTVDAFAGRHERPTVVRMDVEGYELEVVRGMRETGSALSLVFIEVHSYLLGRRGTDELFGVLEESGLRPVFIVKDDTPGFSTVLPVEYAGRIRGGDAGVYQVFFGRNGIPREHEMR